MRGMEGRGGVMRSEGADVEEGSEGGRDREIVRDGERDGDGGRYGREWERGIEGGQQSSQCVKESFVVMHGMGGVEEEKEEEEEGCVTEGVAEGVSEELVAKTEAKEDTMCTLASQQVGDSKGGVEESMGVMEQLEGEEDEQHQEKDVSDTTTSASAHREQVAKLLCSVVNTPHSMEFCYSKLHQSIPQPFLEISAPCVFSNTSDERKTCSEVLPVPLSISELNRISDMLLNGERQADASQLSSMSNAWCAR
jgi:hypothetical protein